MARRRSHKDVEYHVADHDRDYDRVVVHKTADSAFIDVGNRLVSRGEAILDVVIWSRAGARFYGGDDAVVQYNEDPKASVFERFEFRGNNVGKVP